MSRPTNIDWRAYQETLAATVEVAADVATLKIPLWKSSSWICICDRSQSHLEVNNMTWLKNIVPRLSTALFAGNYVKSQKHGPGRLSWPDGRFYEVETQLRQFLFHSVRDWGPLSVLRTDTPIHWYADTPIHRLPSAHRHTDTAIYTTCCLFRVGVWFRVCLGSV